MSGQIPFKALKTFEAVVRNGSFSRAADELHVTQSAVSHQVAALETWLGRSLFDRSGSRPRTLADADRLAATLASAFADIEEACRRAGNPETAPGLNVAVIPSVATCWLIPRLATFKANSPEIRLHVMYAIHGQPLNFSEADLAIIFASGAPDIPGAVATKLLSGASSPVCSQSYLNTNGPLRTPARIAAAELLHDTGLSGWAKWLATATGKETHVADGPVFEDFNLLRAATLAGQGVALCPLAIIEDDLVTDRLVRLSDIKVGETSAYYLVEPKRHGSSEAAVTAFRQWLLEQAVSDVQSEPGDNNLP